MTQERFRPIAVAAVGLLIAIFTIGFVRDLHSGPHVDEVEHLHAALRMARGERIFVDFHEHHSPLYYATLMPLTPDGNGTAVMRGYVTRARVVAGLCVAIVIVVAAVLVWRASASVAAVITFAALILAGGSVWRDGLGDVRPESPSLATWWCGAALVLLAKRGMSRGAGAGLIVIASLMNPKWPLATLVIGAFFVVDLWRRRERLATIATACVVAAVGITVIGLLSDLRLAAFHVLELTRAMVDTSFGSEAARARYRPFFGCPPLVRPWAVAAAVILITAAWARVRTTFAAPRLVAFFVVVAAASLSEIVFVFPFPAVSQRYYAFWVVPAAALLALAPQSLAELLPKQPFVRRVTAAIPAVFAVLALLASLERVVPFSLPTDPYWIGAAWIEARMQPGDTVWLEARQHPIGARDASYYWFGFRDVMPVALRAATTEATRRFVPPIREQDLPLCRLERGLDPNLRFVAGPDFYWAMPTVAACFERLRARGIVQRTPVPHVWVVNR